jgi:redox-sensing transcriptional repressor
MVTDRPTHAEESAEIPKATLERLPSYLRYLIRHLSHQEVLVSSEALADVAGVNPAQVRKDLRYLVESGGTPGVGYEVRKLIYEIEDVLGITKPKEAVLVGAGRLGSALVQYPGFERYGLDIVALFDVDERKIGGKIGEKPILSLDKLADLPLSLGIRLGIICVPADSAQGVAELMVRAGIKVIWNFAPAQLQVPPDVFVRNEDLAAQLAKLSYYLAHRPQTSGGKASVADLDALNGEVGPSHSSS